MDWIERLLHLAPDGGSGLTEMVVGLTVVTAIAMALTRRRWTATILRIRRRGGAEVE